MINNMNFDEWLQDYKAKNETAKYMSKRDLKKAYQRELDAYESEKLLNQREQEELLSIQQKKDEQVALERLAEENVSYYVQKVQAALNASEHYLKVPEIEDIEQAYCGLVELQLGQLQKNQRELLILLPKLIGRSEYLKAQQYLKFTRIMEEQNILLNTVLKSSGGSDSKNLNSNNLSSVVAASSLLVANEVKSMGDDVELISEGIGITDE